MGFPIVPLALGVPTLLRATPLQAVAQVQALLGSNPIATQATQIATGILAGNGAPVSGITSLLTGAGVLPPTVNQIVGTLTSSTAGGLINTASSLLTGDASAVTQSQSVTLQWGLFDNSGGGPDITGDSVLEYEHMGELSTPDYPLEDGGFQSYNKVPKPIEIRMTFAKGGSEDDRGNFLALIQNEANSLDTFTAMSPIFSYERMTIIHYTDRTTSEKGITLLTVEVGLKEVRNEATETFTNTANPSGADTQINGATQATTPTAAQTSVVAAQASQATV